jgi:pyruvate dehydrogenase E2 component (dihydrolipoamide acetyltransferase)
MESGSIANWTVKAGDSFGPGDVLCSVETDKATVDFEAQDEGFVAKVLVPAGPDEIKVGSPIMVITDSEDKVAAFADFSLANTAAKAPAAAVAAPAAPAAAAAPATAPPTPVVATATTTTSSTGDRVVASPLAHKLAKEMGYDIAQMAGTGPAGRIIASDVKEYVPGATAAVPAAAAPTTTPTLPAAAAVFAAATPVAGAGFTDYPLSDAAREIAARLQQSKRNVPHYYLTVDISVDKLLELRESLNASSSGKDNKLGVYEFLIKAAAASMKAVPSVNAAWMDSHVRVYDSVDMNVVLGAGDSLVAPVLANVSRKGLAAISQELGTMTQQVMDASPSSAAGLGTFTIMNFGMYGIKSCAPIIREPQSSALALGALENRIVPNDKDGDEIYKESVMLTATLSCDHRVVDGAVGAQWLAAFKSHVENPVTLLL